MLETELFEPIKHYLQEQGFKVNAEVKDCDVIATLNDDLIVVELKTSVNLKLLIQATDRQKISDSVYVALPAPNKKGKHWRGVQRILKSLQLGLLLVNFSPLGATVNKVFDPTVLNRRYNKRRRHAVIREISERSSEYNTGGSTRVKLVTAYREQAILIATILEKLKRSSPKQLRAIGTGDKTLTILHKNHYNWFEKVDRGVYKISATGKKEIRNYPDLYLQSKKFLQSYKESLAKNRTTKK